MKKQLRQVLQKPRFAKKQKNIAAEDGTDTKKKDEETSGEYIPWGGRWLGYTINNPSRRHNWLPNDAFASAHISLCAHFQINEDMKTNEWR